MQRLCMCRNLVKTILVADLWVQVWQLGQFGMDSKLNPGEVMTIMLSMTTHSLSDLVSSLFEVFGEHCCTAQWHPVCQQRVTALHTHGVRQQGAHAVNVLPI